MNYNKKYPSHPEKTFVNKDIYKHTEERECFICKNISTKFQYIWIVRGNWGFPKPIKVHICSEECRDYYDIMKGLLHEN